MIVKTTELTRYKSLEALLYIHFKVTSPTEVSLVSCLIAENNGGPVTISPPMREDISKATGIPIASLPTATSRLEKSGVLRKEGKTIYPHPAFNKWNETSQINIKIK